MAWDTAVNILNDAAVELGLYSTDLADPYDSTDPNVIQLCRLLKRLGQDILRDFKWSNIGAEHTFSTVNGTPNYDLPVGLARVVDGTFWNRTQQLPLVGPVNEAQWQAIQAQTSIGPVTKVFRVWKDDLWLHPTPTAIETVAYEYVSRYWVQPTGQSSPTTETPTDGTDTLWLDRSMLVTGLKLYFLRAKGFDSSAAQVEFEDAVARAQGGDGAAPTLTVGSGSSIGVNRLLDDANVPETGFGS